MVFSALTCLFQDEGHDDELVKALLCDIESFMKLF